MELHTVFDAGYGWSLLQALSAMLFMITAGSVLVYQPRFISFKGSPNTKTVSLFGWAIIAFSLLWAALAIYSTYHEREVVADARSEGRVDTIEGYVTEFTPTRLYGHENERFCISIKCFSYDEFVDEGGFHQTSFHGGPMRLGIYAKVEYMGNIITHLEVSKEDFRE